MTLVEKQARLLASLAAQRDPQERLAWLVEQARRRPALEAAFRTDAHRVEGCLAKLWLVGEWRDGRCYFQSESDSLIVKAVAGLLCEFYSGHTPAEIEGHPPDFLGQLGITQHLTASRRHGLSRVWNLMRTFAAGCTTNTQLPRS